MGAIRSSVERRRAQHKVQTLLSRIRRSRSSQRPHPGRDPGAAERQGAEQAGPELGPGRHRRVEAEETDAQKSGVGQNVLFSFLCNHGFESRRRSCFL